MNLKKLNDSQKAAVEAVDTPVLIFAGAGSGKTRVLTYKISYLIKENIVKPEEILAVTFTNKAAGVMKQRVSDLLKDNVQDINIGTFHSICAKILRNEIRHLGYTKNFAIYDASDQISLIKVIMAENNLTKNNVMPKTVRNKISSYKSQLINPKAALKFANNIQDKIIVDIYKSYNSSLKENNAVDFDDLLNFPLEIFNNHPRILGKYQKLWKYILVDEYQDINFSQQLWLNYLYRLNKNICCVGDDDQSIYSWRGAEIKNILSFEKTFENPSIIRLEQNYRSTKRILNCASHLINNNKNRYGKNLWSDNNTGDKVEIRGFWETKEEAKNISDQIEDLIRKKVSLNEIAILMRVAAHTRSFEERFLNVGLPYRIIGGIKFYERREIKDIIAYLRIVNNFDDDLALERIINVPKRGIGKTTIKKINLIIRKNKISMFEACKVYVGSEEKNKIKYQINELISKIHKWNSLKKQLDHIELCELILEDSGYMEFIDNESKQKDNIENYDRLDNINEFMNSLKDFENLDGFLEHISLVNDNENINENNKINLMTMHSAKGLEFNYVFAIGWEEGLFPSKRSIEEKGSLGLEEERRLAYVALTRAKKKIFISFVTQNRYSYANHDFNVPSRFIKELPKEELNIYNSEVFQNYNYSNDFNENFEESEILTPGKKRMIDYYKIKDNNLEFNQEINIVKTSNFEEGERIFHKKFGYGRILEIENDTALINFEKSETKMIFLKYLIKEI